MSRVFGKIVQARTRLYDSGVFSAHRLGFPVISVGNLTAGGTGKTPLVIELAARFRDMGHKPVILSRGYRRRSRGVVVVSRGNGPEVGWETSGDEPFLMAVRLPGVSVVVGRNRFRAGLRAEAENLGNLFLLDDGFQHRRLHRDVDILAVDPGEWAQPDLLLPRGRWREPRTAIHRAHAACVGLSDSLPIPNLPVPTFRVRTEVEGLVRDGRLSSPEAFHDQPVVAFAGIAKPHRFFEALENLGIHPSSTRAFPDHHRYTARDLASLGQGVRITTEKDAVRLATGDFYFLRISANILEFKELRDLILKRIMPK